MKEQAYSFGDKKGLCGVITDPSEKNADLPGLIILNSGLIPHIGPNRLSVQLARQMSESGYTALRFDFSGIGDSQLRSDFIPFEQSAPLETRQAMDFLQKARGISRFVVTGICSGADTSFFTALEDERIVGIIPIDFYGVGSVGYQLSNYRKRLLQPRSWMNLATGKSDIWNLVSKLPEKLSRKEQKPADTTSSEIEGAFPSTDKIVEHFHTLFAREFAVLLLYSAGSPSYYNYTTIFRSALRDYASKGVLRITYLKDSDHGFTLRYNQELYLQNTNSWLLATFSKK